MHNVESDVFVELVFSRTGLPVFLCAVRLIRKTKKVRASIRRVGSGKWINCIDFAHQRDLRDRISRYVAHKPAVVRGWKLITEVIVRIAALCVDVLVCDIFSHKQNPVTRLHRVSLENDVVVMFVRY